jgi:hypothetical protein
VLPRRVTAPRVVGDPLRLFANHLEDVLERVGRPGRAQARVQRWAGLKFEDWFGLALQQLGRESSTLQVDVEFVRATANLIMLLQHGDFVARGRQQASARQPSEAAADDDVIDLVGSEPRR